MRIPLPAVNLNTGVTGVSASVNAATGIMTFDTVDGRDITVTETIANGATTNTTGNGVDDVEVSTGAAIYGTVTLSANETIQLGGGQEAVIGLLQFGRERLVVPIQNLQF